MSEISFKLVTFSEGYASKQKCSTFLPTYITDGIFSLQNNKDNSTYGLLDCAMDGFRRESMIGFVEQYTTTASRAPRKV